jgi:hypothetical protein
VLGFPEQTEVRTYSGFGNFEDLAGMDNAGVDIEDYRVNEGGIW